jgi:hypothetical protein
VISLEVSRVSAEFQIGAFRTFPGGLPVKTGVFYIHKQRGTEVMGGYMTEEQN